MFRETPRIHFLIICLVFVIFFALIFLAFKDAFFQNVNPERFTTKAREFYVVEVADGDTITVQDDNFVRLIGIDAPEKNKPCFEESKKALEDLVLNKYVILSKDISQRDKYGRLLRYVFIDGKNTSIKMVKNGLAVAMPIAPDLKYAKEIKEAVNEAKQEKIGCLNQNKK